MTPQRILIVGCGKIGLRVATQLSKQHEVWGLKRNKPQDSDTNIHFISADVCQKDSLKNNLPKNLDYILYCLSPSERNEQAYRDVYLSGLQNILSALEKDKPLKRFYFISSTSVYHQNQSELVDETSPTIPASFSGKVLLEAEALCSSMQSPSTIIRFSGIYGAQRSHLIQQVASNKAQLNEELRLTNRIHEDDCVGFIQYLIQEDMLGRTNKPLYLASDSQPVDLNDVINFIASTLNINLQNHEGNHSSTRRAGNKRCNNQLMLASGYVLLFPGYQEGYLAMLNQTQLS